MQNRMKQQPQRKQRLQQRWGMLRSDLDTIQKAREVTIEPNGHTFKVTAHSALLFLLAFICYFNFADTKTG